MKTEDTYIVHQSPKQSCRAALAHIIVIVDASSKKEAIEKASTPEGGINASDKDYKKPIADKVHKGGVYHL
jgi:hypothetical protein